MGVDENPNQRNPEAGGPLIERVKSVAQAITDRVHEVLNHYAPLTLPAGTGSDTRPLKVLVVDDNPDAADACAGLRGWLRACSVARSGACRATGVTALELVRMDSPDVCLLDLMMPGLDGLALAAMVKAQAGRRPMLLVATTALGSLEDRTATALAGFHFHLVKPIDTPTLRAALDRFRALTQRRPPAGGG